MNVDQCQWRKKMMGRGVDGGCGAEEKPYRPFRRVALDKENGYEDMGSLEIDFLAQASKNLSERSPFDVPEDGSTSVLSVPTLPIALANLLKNHSDNKKRHKKSHSGADKKKKKSSRQGDKLRSGSIWLEHEDYFRRLDFPDLETLSDLASLRSLSSRNCFSIPSVEYDSIDIQQRETDASAKNEDVVCGDGVVLEQIKNLLTKDISEGTVRKEEDVVKPMGVDNVGNGISSGSDYSGSLEWVLGNRNRILLTSERPSKKRKLLGSDAGLGKLMVAAPCEGNALLCDFCCTGHHQLIVCTSCKATVHKKCYGLLEDSGKPWLCSWCELENGRADSERPCLLCPKKGGILKPVLSKTENGGPAEFAHLFCSLWMPEVYIEDLKKMEPILNFPGIKETRRKLLCNLCKVKSGACIRCCNVVVLTLSMPDNPIVWIIFTGKCFVGIYYHNAVEAGNRLEVWGKHGCDTVELRAFCSKHSDIQESGKSVEGGESNAAESRSPICHLPSESVGEGHLSNDEMGVDVGTPGTGSDISRNSDLQELESPHSKFNLSATDNVESGMTGRSNEDERTLSKSLSFGLILKKLIDLGKVDVKDVAAEIGINPDALRAKLTDGDLLPDLLGKVVKWLSQHAHMGSSDKGKNLKPKANGSVLKKEGSVSLAPDHSPEEKNSIVLDQKVHHGKSSVIPSDDHGEQSNSSSSGVMMENAFSLRPNSSQNRGNLNCPNPIILDLFNQEAYPGFNPHRYIHKELSELGKEQTLKSSTDSDVARMTTNFDGSEEGNKHLQGAETFLQLSKARKLGILDLSPEDELEGELLYYQLQLLGTAVSRKQLSDNLVYEVAKKLPLEIDEQHGRRWDDVLVNKYFHDVREARKQGRKEQRNKQAQAVLAAATAAAATSSRNTSLRKDMSEEPAQQEMSTSRRKVVGSSHLVPQTKESLLKMAVSGPPSEKRSDHHTPDFLVENPRTCDICRRSETIWNLIVVCSSCKVAVHIDCYKCAKESTGPWYCELCAESSSEPSFNFGEKPNSSTECTLCGGTTGAFRKTTNGQWVHAFCAEWSLESTFRRGQINPVQGMESLAKKTDNCCVCQRIYGACTKCSYGNCQTTFHPSCARSAGFHMTGGGKHPHKAYCEKHSMEQKAKAESQKHGAEELKSLKHYRVELERLRLLCERIVKREKLKRELAISSHEILAAKRDHAARPLHVRNPFSPPEVSSDSATTSIKGHPDSNISGSEAIQRSDDITIDSTVTDKRRGKGPLLMDTDQKTDDSATSKSRFSRKLTERQILSGKTVPRKHCIVSPSVSEDGDNGSKPKKHVETFAKELVMTSDEASFKNRRLPKGYFYVPVDCLQEDKPGNQKLASSDKPANQKTSSGDQSGKDDG
ncbi:PHD finger family protein [Arabidopsis thaliana]|uniref:PHD finger family protein n=1 Tax=Arabidopsis thaliana TaxID=3702 RepID=F4I8J4_ARATH|nr:PHD finger family protein [Arabidopsis thaliana]AEE36028.1 PHD finger family protein [Arabidopsis thaliana]|eukprot:NP_001185422.1 PHD finger family protein [Arabidopsis thaliana]